MTGNAYSVRRMSNEEAHRLARENGVSRWLYALVRAIVSPLFRVYFRMHVSGADCIPAEGPAIVAPNHKSFWDSFFIAVCTPRHVRFMAKTELIEARYGRLLVRLGAFPVRRAMTGTEKIFRGGFPVPRRVQVAFSRPIPVSDLATSPAAASELVEGTLWPEVEGSYRRLRARPTLIAAGLAALGIGGGLFFRRKRRR